MTPQSATPSGLVLAEHPFFRGMDAAFLRQVAEGVQERNYETGATLFQEGEPASEFLLVFRGKVALELATAERPRLTIETVGPGETLGWSWLSPPFRWRFDGRALKPTQTLALNAVRLRALLEEHPADGYRFLLRLLPIIGERLEMARLQILDIHGV